MNGALGRDVNGFSSTRRTVQAAASSVVTSPCAAGSSSTTTASLVGFPSGPKSLPVATRRPSRPTSVAANAGSVGKAASRSQ